MSTLMPNRPDPLTTPRRLAIVASTYNLEFVQGLIEGAVTELSVLAPSSEIEFVRVPGSFEIPLAVQTVAQLKNVHAVFAFGLIWEGKTRHADLIATSVTNALLDISLKHSIPVLHEVLVVQNEEQARERCTPGSDLNRGVEAARAAVRMIGLLEELSEPGA